MTTARISSKYQVVIPKPIRDIVPIHAGQDVQVIAKGGVIILVPDQPLSELRGFVQGIDVSEVREKEDRS